MRCESRNRNLVQCGLNNGHHGTHHAPDGTQWEWWQDVAVHITAAPKTSAARQLEIFLAIVAERARQQSKHGDRSIAGDIPLSKKVAILSEELLEVVQAADRLETAIASGVGVEAAQKHLDDELIQVAACAVGWLEGMK